MASVEKDRGGIPTHLVLASILADLVAVPSTPLDLALVLLAAVVAEVADQGPLHHYALQHVVEDRIDISPQVFEATSVD